MAENETLESYGDYIDPRGRQLSPLLQRGADGLPTRVDVPTVDELRGFDTRDPGQQARMYGMLNRFQRGSILQRKDATKQYLERFNILDTDPRFQDEYNRLLDSVSSNRVLLAQSRRTAERYQTLGSIDGKLNQQVIYLQEGPEPCDECIVIDFEGPYSEAVSQGYLPGDRCLGGDFCMCVLVPSG